MRPADQRNQSTWRLKLASTLPIYLLVFLWIGLHLESDRASTLAWIQVARMGGKVGFGGMEQTARITTLAATATAAFGAILRVAGARGAVWMARSGLIATCAPLCLLLPGWRAAAFLLSALLAASTINAPNLSSRPTLREVLCRESFPVLCALSFMVFSGDYNAALLTRAIVVAAGISLVLRATIPREAVPER